MLLLHSVTQLIVVAALILTAINDNRLLQNQAMAELVVTSLLGDAGINVSSEPCSIHANDGNHSVTLHGSPSNLCQLQISVTSSNQSAILVHIPGEFRHNDFLSVRSLDDALTTCPNDEYLVIHGQGEACSLVLIHQKLQFNWRSNVSLVIREIAVPQSTACSGSLHDDVFLASNVSLAFPLCSVTSYHDIMVCADVEGSHFCRLNFSRNCDITIGVNEITLECLDKTNMIYRQRVAIIYPIPTFVLDAAENNITAINNYAFQDLRHLHTLDLQQNRLDTLKRGTFIGLNQLLYLHLQDNVLSTLDPGCFRVLRILSTLDLSGNKLSVLPAVLFQNLTELSTLRLNSNQLVTLDKNLFKDLNNLKILSLDENQIAAVEPGLFHSLSNLTALDLAFNKLVDIPAKLFENLENLDVLSLCDNLLMTLDADSFQGTPNLRQLRLDHNRIAALEAGLFRDLQRLKNLYLHNQLEKLDVGLFDGLQNLLVLGLQYNHLVTLDGGLFRDLKSLVTLNLYQNQLTTLSDGLFASLNSLIILFLTHNKLSTLDQDSFQGLHNLQLLTLGYNQLVSIPAGLFRGMHSLGGLGLKSNRIRDLHADAFKDLINLDTLTLQRNNLERVDANLFQNTVKLSSINLGDNRLQNIPNINHLKMLRSVFLEGNDLQEIHSREAFSNLPDSVILYVNQHEICECYVPGNVTCSASFDRSPYLLCDRLLSDRVLVVMIWLIGINALCGNLFVLCWRKTKKDKNKVQSLLLRNLAMSDLLMGVYMIIVAIADIYFGHEFPMRAEAWRTGITCKIAGALSITSSQGSVFFVTVISVDRFVSIKYPGSPFKFGNKSIAVTIALVWTVAASLGVIPSIFAGKNHEFYDNSHVCIGLPLALMERFSTKSEILSVQNQYTAGYEVVITRAVSQGKEPGMFFSTAIFLGLNTGCFLLIVACYVIIVRVVHKSSKRAGLTEDMRNQIRLTAKVAMIVISDFLCWAPVITLGILVQCRVLTLPPSVFAWCVTFVLPVNSALNPYLYTIADLISRRRKLNDHSSRSDGGRTRLQRRTDQQQSSHASAMRHQHTVSSSVQDQESIVLPNVVPIEARRDEVAESNV